ncbi:MAG: hypothetical protein COA79_11615 [Planctomycetota bacterium]|nr:MAG: hypothetical protein COA79_11615 [Planctomycetota bacterium]
MAAELKDERFGELKSNTEKPLNILMVFSDEHNSEYSGYRNHSIVETPNLDKFASESAVFTNAYCNSPLCSPSRQSFMAGLFCHEIGMWNNTCSMPEDTVTWAHALSAAGYETSLLGKMHFNGYQKMYGFDKRPVLEGNTAGQSFYSWGIRSSHSWKDPLPYKSGKNGMNDELKKAGPDIPERNPIFQKDLEVLQGTKDFLKEKSEDNSGKPWAACASFVLPHPPWTPRKDCFEKYKGKGDLPFNHKGEGRDTCDQYLQKFYGDVRNLSEDEIKTGREAYYGLITEFDDYFGQLMDQLDQSGLAENTVVFYFSDHGEMAGKHGNWAKVSLLEDSIRIPLMIRWPGVSEANCHIDTPVSLVDLFPTFLDVPGIEWPSELPLSGNSLKPLLEKKEDEFKGTEVFCEFDGEGWNHPRALIRKGDWKYVYNHTADHRLYNLKDDPNEMNDLSENEEFKEKLLELKEGLMRHWNPVSIEEKVIQSQIRMSFAYNKNKCKDLGW